MAESSITLPTIIPQNRATVLAKIHFHFESLVKLDINALGPLDGARSHSLSQDAQPRETRDKY